MEANRGRVAVTRGPFVYCAEGVDNDGDVFNRSLGTQPAALSVHTNMTEEGVLRGVVSVTIASAEKSGSEERERDLALIPYYAWND